MIEDDKPSIQPHWQRPIRHAVEDANPPAPPIIYMAGGRLGPGVQRVPVVPVPEARNDAPAYSASTESCVAADLKNHYDRLKCPPQCASGPTARLPKPKGRKPSILTEAAVERQIIDLLEAHGWLVLRTNNFCGQGFVSQGAIEPGMPDLQARFLIPWVSPVGEAWQILWIEVKRPGGKVSLKQATWHQLAQRRGETVIVAESVETVARAIGVRL